MAARLLVIAIVAWIGLVWPGIWTALLMLLALAIICLCEAYDGYERKYFSGLNHPKTG